MDKEKIRNDLSTFMNYRKEYMKEKKALLLEYLTSNREDLKEQLIKLKESFYQEFLKFVETLPDQLKVSKDFVDEDLIFWFIFTLDEVLNNQTELVKV